MRAARSGLPVQENSTPNPNLPAREPERLRAARQAEDVAAAVVYALSAPPHVDVNDILMRPVQQKS
jgi:NADP-dependent 3-hydroxy acid dehydrogenase YdfG